MATIYRILLTLRTCCIASLCGDGESFCRVPFPAVGVFFDRELCHEQNNFDPPDIGHYSIKQALAGVKRARRELPNTKNPSLSFYLTMLLDHLYWIPQEIRIVFWWANSIALYSLLRKSNLFADRSRSGSRTESHLRVQDVTLTTKGLISNVRVIKTSRFQNTEAQIPV